MPPVYAHLAFTPEADHLADLHARLDPAVTLSTGDDAPPQTTILVSGRPSAAQLAALPALQALVIPFAGVPASTAALMADYPAIRVHNLHHNAPMTAEMALALLLAAAKRLIPIHNAFAAGGDWRPRFDAPRNLHLAGRTALVLGYGAIGQRVAAVLRAFEMRVMAVRRTPDDTPDVYPMERLPELLPVADVLMVCLPGTPQTTGLIGARELALLPPGAVVVNVGRAAVIDETALYQALASGHLYGAGADVWYSYPASPAERAAHPPASQPFWTLQNMVMSPHRAGGFGAVDVETARMAALAALFNAAARGQPLPNPVNPDLSY